MTARELLEQLHRELAPVEQAIASHRYLQAPPPRKLRSSGMSNPTITTSASEESTLCMV